MNKGSFIPLVAVIVILLVGLGVYVARSQIGQSTPGQTPSPQTSTSPSPVSSENDLPPLYPGVEWGQISEGEVVFSTIDNQTIKLKGYAVESATIEDYAGLFDYYKTRLTSAGWRETSYAFGPNGESYDYEKDGKYFSFGVRLISMYPEKYKAFITYSI